MDIDIKDGSQDELAAFLILIKNTLTFKIFEMSQESQRGLIDVALDMLVTMNLNVLHDIIEAIKAAKNDTNSNALRAYDDAIKSMFHNLSGDLPRSIFAEKH